MKTIFTSLLILTVFALNAQTGIYRTYADYEKNNLEVMDDWMTYTYTMLKVTVSFKDKGKKIDVPCSSIWGFKYEGKLFRCDQVYSLPCRVINVGKVVYYQNGTAHMNMIKTKSNEGLIDIGFRQSFSKTLNSEMICFDNAHRSEIKKQRKEFLKANPEFQQLFDCAGEANKTDIFGGKKCIEEYNK